MDWSPGQEDALRRVREWYTSRDKQVFRMFGYAGTGKTTLARQIAQDIGGQVDFASYTGKAALVLRGKGCEGATTIHQLIYNPKDRGRGRLKQLEDELFKIRDAGRGESLEALDLEREIEREKERLRQPVFQLNENAPILYSDLVIVDEVSMVDGRIGEDLLSFGKPVLVLGDPAQLPPVKGSGFFMSERPDVMLTEIHRQARDNPIIELATRVREGKMLEYGSYGESKVVRKNEVDQGEVLAADQVIVGRNATRHAYNKRIRELTGRAHWAPIPGDKLVCLRNDHDKGLLNGAIWHAGSIASVDEDRIFMDVRSEDDPSLTLEGLECHTKLFTDPGYKMMWFERIDAAEFDFGYVLTGHKSQGSQWGDIYVFDESWVFRNDAMKWLYTSITRAAQSITIVR